MQILPRLWSWWLLQNAPCQGAGEHSRPYFETLYESLTKIAAADPRARNPYLRRDDIKRTLLVVIAGDRLSGRL